MELKRNNVIALYLAGKLVPAIVRELSHLKVNKMFVYRTINRYNITGSIAKRYGGGPKKTATSPEMILKVGKRIERNPRRSANQMAKDLKISRERMQHILKNELMVKPYKFQKAHDLTPDETTYCLCDQISFGEMILCDNDLCPIEWFHLSCVSLVLKPKGKWYCPNCRGDRQNIMKPKPQFVKELEKYNKEKKKKLKLY